MGLGKTLSILLPLSLVQVPSAICFLRIYIPISNAYFVLGIYIPRPQTIVLQMVENLIFEVTVLFNVLTFV